MSVMIAYPQNIAAQYSRCVKEYHLSSVGYLGRLINPRMTAVSHFNNFQQSQESTHLTTKNKRRLISERSPLKKADSYKEAKDEDLGDTCGQKSQLEMQKKTFFSPFLCCFLFFLGFFISSYVTKQKLSLFL